MANPNQNRLPRLTPNDLKDPSLSKLHSIFDGLLTEAQYGRGVQGKVNIQNEMSAKNIKISNSGRVLQSDDVVTYGDLDKIGVIEIINSSKSSGSGSSSISELIIPTY